jgi:hypothetical protein
MRYLLGWVTVTALVTLAAWQVVGAAQERVGEVPTAPLVAVSAPGDETSPTSTIDSTVSEVPGQSTTSTTRPSGTTPGSTTSTTRPSNQSTTPTSSTTSTTQVILASGTATIPSTGGTVTVSYANGQVYLQGASPAIGFSAEVKDQGPDEVRVEFRSEGLKVDVRARWEAGGLVTSVSEELND